MRRILVASALSALMALTAPPATAKVQVVPDEAVISGPGIEEDIHLDSGSALSLVDRTQGWDTFYGGFWLNSIENYDGQLGPRYTITYSLSVQDHRRPGKVRSGTFTQFIYPFASDGPVQVVPPGQELPIRGIHEMGAGWAPLNKFAMQHLEYYGIPKSNPSAAAGAERRRVTDASKAYLWALMAVFLIGVGVLGNRRVWVSQRPAA